MSPEALARLRKDLADQVAPSRDDLRALLDAYDTARAEGVAAERARVVAWLRETRDGSTDWQQESHDLLTLALRAGAAGIVLVHNHPSGSAEPSTPDIATSRRLAQVGKALSVRVLDSIVVAGHAYVSLAERNLLEGSSVAALG